MPYQVGNFCYANAASAGVAACSNFQPLRIQTATQIISTTCLSSGNNGELNLNVATTTIATNSTVNQVIQQLPTFPACTENLYLDYLAFIVGGLLGIYVIWLTGWKILSFLGWSRGNND